MSMPTTDYNQQLLCYLQEWRRLLEQWTATAGGSPLLTAPPAAPAGMQFMPPTTPLMPFMPPMPPMPMGPPTAQMSPVPGDYTQQLFSYLQAWRQYLEQALGASPASPQAGAAASANDGGTSGTEAPDVLIPPVNPTGSRDVLQSDDKGPSGPTPPKLVDRAPNVTNQTAQFEFPLAGFPERFQMADPRTLSARPGASPPISEALARPQVGSAFVSAMNRVGPTAASPVVRRSLFSTPGESARLQEVGETHSP
jgi:hypothetical protein